MVKAVVVVEQVAADAVVVDAVVNGVLHADEAVVDSIVVG